MAVAELSEGVLEHGIDVVARGVVSRGAALGRGLVQPLVSNEARSPAHEPSGRQQENSSAH